MGEYLESLAHEPISVILVVIKDYESAFDAVTLIYIP